MMRRLLLLPLLTLFLLPLRTDASHWANYYRSAAVQGPAALSVPAGGTIDVELRFVNKGWYLWRGGGTGWRYVSLYSVSPYARVSAFRHAGWKSSIQPAALWEYRVWPGETGTFKFTLQAPSTPGTYVEQFRMAIEDTAWVEGSDVALTIHVTGDGAAPVSAGPALGARAYAVIDAATGEVLAEKNADEVRSIASITKLATVMTAKRLGVDPDAVISMEREDEVGGGRLRMAYGTRLTVRNLIAAALVGSANNSANAVARATGFPRADFVGRMNEFVASLGLSRTRFADPTGIEVENLSTAREVALLGRAAFADAEIARLTSAASWPVIAIREPETRDILNTNRLVADSRVTVLGGKTGFINEAGYTLVTKVRKQYERDLVVVVLGCDTKTGSFDDARRLAEWAWSQ